MDLSQDFSSGLGKVYVDARQLPIEQVFLLHNINVVQVKGKVLYNLSSVSP